MTVANKFLTKEDVFNQAWKILRLPEFMRQKGYQGADEVEQAIVDATFF